MIKNLKVSKNVTFDTKTLSNVVALMNRTGRNFSVCINMIISQWQEMQDQLDRLEIENKAKEIRQSKILREGNKKKVIA